VRMVHYSVCLVGVVVVAVAFGVSLHAMLWWLLLSSWSIDRRGYVVCVFVDCGFCNLCLPVLMTIMMAKIIKWLPQHTRQANTNTVSEFLCC